MKTSTLFKNRLITAINCLFIAVSSNIMADSLQTLEQKASYAIGVNFVQSINVQGIKLDTKSLVQGVSDSVNGTLALSQEEMKQAFDEFKEQLLKQEQEEQKAQQVQADKNKQQGIDFLAQNKKKEGVITLPSGLQYKVLISGTGPSPKASDKVTTHYRGTLIDGTEFDSSFSRNAPATFPVNGVIPGWVEALQLMHTGDKWQLFIPSDLAYGTRSVGQHIKANSTLIFEIELLKINGQ